MSAWRITWDGKSWTDDDLTGQHLATLALISGDDRFEDLAITEDEVRTYPGQGYMRLLNMLSALVAVDVAGELPIIEAQEAVVEALGRIHAASADDILGCVAFG